MSVRSTSYRFRRAVQNMINAAYEVEQNWPDGMEYPPELDYLPSWDAFLNDLMSLEEMGEREEMDEHENPARRSVSRRAGPRRDASGRFVRSRR